MRDRLETVVDRMIVLVFSGLICEIRQFRSTNDQPTVSSPVRLKLMEACFDSFCKLFAIARVLVFLELAG